MSTAIAEKKMTTKRRKRPAEPQGQKPKARGKKAAKSNPWMMILMVVGLLGTMAFLFSPNDPGSFSKNGSSEAGKSSASGFGKGVIGK
ncbi:hypothetical protein UZ36_03445 [Candidatus Nitromaritima sp. SCGC AAA799-C22]|nr:hypothetical protein UZ36_03445 [Candidatus Nitromaritima sp. SCGC AAA799-C22]